MRTSGLPVRMPGHNLRGSMAPTSPGHCMTMTQRVTNAPAHAYPQYPIMRRWLLRIIIGIVLLLGVVALTVHIVLRTDVPRRMVLSALHENTGLRFDAASLTTGWGGRTELTNLTVALPLERDPFLTIPSLRITHTDLLRLAIFRSIDVDEAIVEQPHLVLRQDAAGAWNFARAAAVVENVQMQRAPAQRGPARSINLPTLSVRGARIDVYPGDPSRPQAQVITYAPIDLEGRPDAPLAWEFEAFLERQRVAAGHLSPRGRWPHRLELDIERAAPHLDPWRVELAEMAGEAGAAANGLPEIPHDLSIAATWQGQLTDDGVSGRITLDRFVAAGMSAHGAATLAVVGSTIIIEPHELRLDDVHPEVQSVRLVSGRIIHEGDRNRTRLARLRVESHGPDATAPLFRGQIDGEYDALEERGSASVNWTGHIMPWQAAHEGAIALSITVPAVGRRMFEANIVSQGTIPQGAWDADLHITGYGRTWTDIAGRIAAPRFDFITTENEYDFSGFAARFARDDRDVHLTHLDLPSAAPPPGTPQPLFRGRGRFNIDTLGWSADLAATNWVPPARMPHFEIMPLDFALRATGVPGGREVQLDDLTVQAREGTFTLAGRYSADEPHAPVAARLTIDMNIPDASETLTGRARGEINLAGIIEPLHLNLDGAIDAIDLAWEDRNVESIALRLRGSADKHHAVFESDEFPLAGGTWKFRGDWRRDNNNAMLVLEGRDAQVEQLIAIAGGPPEFAGAISTNVDVVIPQLELSRADLAGSWTAADLRAAGLPLHVTTGRGFIRATRERAHFTDLLLQHDGGTMHGSAVLDLTNRRTLSADITADQWPLAMDALDFHAHASGDASLDIDLVDFAAAGDVNLNGSATFREVDLGEFAITGSILGRTLNLHNMTAAVLGGEASGAGTLVLEPGRWTESTADFTWDGVNLSLLAEHSERFAPFRGISSGYLSARRTDDVRAPEPIRIDAVATLRDARYGAIDIEAASLEAFLGSDRLMIRSARATVADGEVNFWGRLTAHDGVPFAHLHVNVDRIDLQQIATFMEFASEDRPMPGRVSGGLAAGGYVVQPRREAITNIEGQEVEIITGPRLFGQGQLFIVESDLVALPGFAALYDVLRIDFGGIEATGRGEATIRLENNALEISRLTYFNRGTDIVARLRMENIWDGADSPIAGLAAGVIRPLRDIDLPLVARLDRLIGAIQTDTASVRIGGTLADHEAAIVPFSDVTAAISRILRGTVGE